MIILYVALAIVGLIGLQAFADVVVQAGARDAKRWCDRKREQIRREREEREAI